MKKSLLCAAALLCLPAIPAWAGDEPLYQPPPGWVKAAPTLDQARLKAGPSLVVSDTQSRFEDGRVWTYTDTVIRLDTPEALTQWSMLNGTWMPDKGDLIVHRAQILRGDETIDLLGDDKFTVIRRESQLEQRVLTGMLTANMPVKGLRVGDALRLSVSVTERDAALGGKVQDVQVVPDDDTALGFGRIELSWPRDRKLAWRTGPQLTLPADADKVVDGWHVLSVPVGSKRIAMPDDAPQRYLRKTSVQIGDFADWKDVSRTMAPLFATDGLIAPGSPLAEQVAAIEAAHADPLGRTAAALALVQGKISYLLMGMNGGNYVPQTPAHTWDVRYGDCKAKSLLLLSLLRAMGIESEAVLINATADDMLPEVLPLPAEFDHVIVRAVVDGQELWLDGTRPVTQLADIGDSPPFRYALPLRPDGADLVPIVRHPPARRFMTASGTLDATGGIDMPMPFATTITIRGDLAAYIHLAEGQLTPKKRDEMIGSLTRSFIDNAMIGSGTMAWDEATGTITMSVSGVTSEDWSYDHGKWTLSLSTPSEQKAFAPDRARAAWKNVPVATRVSGPMAALLGSASVERTVRLPGGGAGYTIEGDAVFADTLAGLAMTRDIAIAGEMLTQKETIDFSGVEIPAAELPALRTRMAQVIARQPRLVAPADTPRYWQVPQAERRARYAAIEAGYTAVIARDPEDQSGYAWRGWFRDRAGNKTGALSDFAKAIAIEPTTFTYNARARLYEGAGKFAPALADFTAAAELDPSDDTIAADQARLLLKTGKPEQARALLDERIANSGSQNSNLYASLADLMIRAGQGAEAIAVLDEQIASHPSDPTLLNARCWVKGTTSVQLDSALKDCSKAIELSDSPAQSLDSRAMVFFRLNRLEEAQADLDAALLTWPDSASALFMRGVIGKQLGRAGHGSDLAAAREIDPMVDADFKVYGIAP